MRERARGRTERAGRRRTRQASGVAGNIDKVRELYERFNALDFTPDDLIAEDFELHDPDLAGGGTFHGREGLRDYLRCYEEAWREYTVELEDHWEIGDRVLVFLHQTGVGRESALQFDQRDAHVWTFRDGKAVRWRTYLDRDEAMRSVGLDPDE